MTSLAKIRSFFVGIRDRIVFLFPNVLRRLKILTTEGENRIAKRRYCAYALRLERLKNDYGLSDIIPCETYEAFCSSQRIWNAFYREAYYSGPRPWRVP